MSSSLDRVTVDEHQPEDVLQTIAAQAVLVWQSMTPNEKTLVRFGMFPAEKMAAFEAQFDYIRRGDRSRLCAVALMDCAKADGGMQA